MKSPRKQTGSIFEFVSILVILVILFVIAQPAYVELKNKRVVKEARQLSEQRWDGIVAKTTDEQQRALANHLREECSKISGEKISTTQEFLDRETQCVKTQMNQLMNRAHVANATPEQLQAFNDLLARVGE